MENQVDIAAALQVVRRRIWIVLLSVLVAVLAAQGVTSALQPTFEATATLFVTGSASTGREDAADAAADVQRVTLAQNSAASFAQLAQTRSVSVEAARRLGVAASSVEGKLHGESQPGVQLVRLRAESGTGEGAAGLANAGAAALAATVSRTQSRRAGGLRLETVDPAATPKAPVMPRRWLNLVLGGLAGLLLGLGLATLRERLDRRIRSSADVESVLGLPVLAELPRLKRSLRRLSATSRHAVSRIADPYRMLAANIVVASERDSHHRLLISSPSTGEGKSTTAAHLALALAQDGVSTALVECDLHRPTQHREFPSPDRPPLGEQLASTNGSLPPSMEVQPLLKVLAATGSEPAGTLSVRSAEFTHALEAAALDEQRVLLDTPPILGSSDVAVLARGADAALLVVRANRTREADAVSAVAALGRLGVPVLGVVLTSARAARRSSYYGGR
jgi:capsular exopolysaccharide synthesis family protein